jgi:hypothetical protein
VKVFRRGEIAVERADVDLSDELVEVRRRPRSGTEVSVRLAPGEADRLQEVAAARGMTVSQIVREALGWYLSQVNAGERSQTPAGWPWTGTTSGQSYLELTYPAFGAALRTIGEAQEPTPTHPGITGPDTAPPAR